MSYSNVAGMSFMYGSHHNDAIQCLRRMQQEQLEKRRDMMEMAYYPGIGSAQIGDQLAYTQSAGTQEGDVIHVPFTTSAKSATVVEESVNKETKKMATGLWTPVEAVQSYIEKHKEKIITVAAVFLIDHFVFKGKFRVKLEQLFEKLVDKLVGAMA